MNYDWNTIYNNAKALEQKVRKPSASLDINLVYFIYSIMQDSKYLLKIPFGWYRPITMNVNMKYEYLSIFGHII